MMEDVFPFICPSRNSRTERRRKPKIGTMEAHHTGNQWTDLEVKRSKVEVTKLVNAVTYNAPCAGLREFPWRKGESENIFH